MVIKTDTVFHEVCIFGCIAYLQFPCRIHLRELVHDFQNHRAVLPDAFFHGPTGLIVWNKELVLLAAENMKKEADAKAYSVSATMKAVSNIDPKIVQALTSVGMDPSQLIALAFQELAGSADKIGQLNISPDMLQELLKKRRK